MSRTGVEDKPTWRSVPRSIREEVEQTLGSRVARSNRIWGGYSPTPTFRLRLTDGRRAFFKGTNPECGAFAEAAIKFESRTYADLGESLLPWVPQLLGSFQSGDWRVLLLEDVGPKTVPPWTPGSLQGVMSELRRFHSESAKITMPTWMRRFEHELRNAAWDRIFDVPPSVESWLPEVEPTLRPLVEGADELTAPRCLLHGDLRSDNLRWTGRTLKMFDLPGLFVGPPAWEVVMFSQSVALETSIPPENVLALYEQKAPLPGDTVDAAVAWAVVFFAQRAWGDEIEGLPRLRPFQKNQFRVLAEWASRRFGLPVVPREG